MPPGSFIITHSYSRKSLGIQLVSPFSFPLTFAFQYDPKDQALKKFCFVKSYPVLCQCISPIAAFVLWLLGCDPGGITPASNGHVFPGCSWLFCNSTTQLHQGNNCNFLLPNEFHNVISVRPWLRMKLKFDVMVRQEIWLGALFWLGPKWGQALLTALSILCGWWWLQWQ